MHRTGQEVKDIADAICRYLASRPNASETIDGVAKWWLLRQRYDDSVESVQQALDFLEANGEVIRFCVSGGKVMYRRAALN